MAQSRFVLKDEVLEVAEELLQLTRLSNISELTSVLYSRYADHLKSTWKVQASADTTAVEPFPQIASNQTFSAFPDSIDL